MRKRLENLMWFMIENGPTVLTIGFAAYVIALAQTSTMPIETVLQWILAILGLIAVSEMVERLRKIRHIEEVSTKTLQTIENRFGERASADDFFMKHLPAMDAYLEKASNIYLSGIALQRTIRENLDTLTQRLQDGATIKVIMVNPDGQAAQRLALSNPYFSLERLKANAQATIQNLIWLSSLPESKGALELRFMDEEPSFNIIAIDADKEYGIIFVELFPQRRTRQERPRFELTFKRDEYWFIYFREQFEKLWQDCKTVELQNIQGIHSGQEAG